MPTPTVPEALDTGVNPDAISTTPDMRGTKAPKRKMTPAEIAGKMKQANQPPKKYAKGGKVGGASRRADGAAKKGKTRGKFV